MMALILVLLVLMQAQEPSIEGVAVQAGTNQPVAWARILLTNVDARLTDSVVTKTDERGRFAIRDVPPGRYRIVADHDDYVRAAGAATVGPGQPVRRLLLTMTPTGVITGRVVDEHNGPVASVFVRAVMNDAAHEAQTNDLGEYRLFGLAPGSYVVSAAPYSAPRIEGGTYVIPTPPGHPDSRGEGRSMTSLARLLQAGEFIHPMALAGATYAQVYYPGTTDPSAATLVDVQPGAVVSGIDLRTR